MEDKITVKNKTFELYIKYDAIKASVKKVADNINKDFKNKTPVIIGVLNGSFIFIADLAKELLIDCNISFIKVSSYEKTKSTGKVNSIIGLTEDIKNKDVIIVEDIIDTGNTINNLIDNIADKQPKTISLVTLLFKPKSLIYDIKPDYVAIEIPDYFIIGYGLDYDKYGRNLKNIYKLCDN
tara:strand:- start:12 stop:554 length:543 start_codon:yes stop_codon:yes gene_type:complete